MARRMIWLAAARARSPSRCATWTNPPVARVTLNLTSLNQAPRATPDAVAGVEDTALIITHEELPANDVDPDGDALTFVSISDEVPGARAFVRPDGRISTTSDADFVGVATLHGQIGDGEPGSPDSWVFAVGAAGRLRALREASTTFASRNDAPYVGDDAGFSTTLNTPLQIAAADLTANDRDVEGDAFVIAEVLDPVNGTVRIDASGPDGAGARIVFTPPADHVGNGGFSYVVEVAFGARSTGVVSLGVTPDDSLPIAVSDTGCQMDEDGFVLIDPADIIANDSDPDSGGVVFDGIVSAAGGAASLTEDGLIRFAGAPDFDGDALITHRIVDDEGQKATAPVFIDIRSVPDAPRPQGDRFAGTKDTDLIIAIPAMPANDSDPHGQSFQITEPSGFVGGQAALDGVGNVIFTPDRDATGVAGFDCVIADTSGLSGRAHVQVDLAAVNDAPRPIANPDPLRGIEDAPVSHDIRSAFVDPEGDAFTLTVTLAGGAAPPAGLSARGVAVPVFAGLLPRLISAPAEGAPLPAWLSFDGTMPTGVPPQDFNGTPALSIRADDGGAATNEAVDLILAPANDAPIAGDDALAGVDG
jgi:hypothetical protein